MKTKLKPSAELLRYLKSTAPATEADLERLRQAAAELDNDPEFIAEVAALIREEIMIAANEVLVPGWDS